MKYSEFRRWLKKQGVEMIEGEKHTKLYYQGKVSTLPRHGAKEIKEPLRLAILKQLGLNK